MVGTLLWLLATGGAYAVIELYVTGTPELTNIELLRGPALEAFNALKLPLLITISGLVVGSIGFLAGFGTFVALPRFRANARKREINVLLADSVSYMYALSIGGLNQLEILEAMAEAEIYGEVSEEFRSIVLETTYFDTDYRTAMRNQSVQTPSEELSQFLTDMLSIIDSGGDMTDFLSDKKDKHLRTAKQEQALMLETLELFGEMYITLSLFPLLLIIILAIMGMIGTARTSLLYLTVYGLIPLVGVGFLVLVSTVKQDDIGSGYLAAEGEEGERTGGVKGLTDLGLVEGYTDSHAVFDRIRSREGTHETAKLLANPHHFFRDHPLTVLALTVPASAVLVAFGVLGGLAPTSMDGLVDRPVVGTAVWVYIPLYVNFLPLAVFYEWHARQRNRITGKLSETLRKLSSANSTGLTLLDSIELVVDTSSGKLADEFAMIGRQVSYGMSLRAAFVEFNNRYEVPRLARTVNLITKAQESSNRIAAVLTTAAQASENQDDIEREQRSQARMQVAIIIIMTFFTLLAVMAILKVNFLDTMARVTEQSGGGGGAGAAGGGASSLGSGLDVELMGLLFFHAVTIQAVSSGFIAGYIRSGDLLTGAKYAVVLPTFALAVFAVI